jgi:hypothetical protein
VNQAAGLGLDQPTRAVRRRCRKVGDDARGVQRAKVDLARIAGDNLAAQIDHRDVRRRQAALVLLDGDDMDAPP